MGEPGAILHLARKGSVTPVHLEILNEAQSEILPVLGPWAADRNLYLGGGTSVALHFGHRRSLDFDLFAPDEITEPLILAQQLRECGLTVEDVNVAPGTLHSLIEQVRVSIFEYPYPLVDELVPWPVYSISLASLDDLACMKLAAVAQRGSRKDFIDVYEIALSHKPIRDILPLYQRKYSIRDIGHILVGMTYFDDADDEPMPKVLKDLSWGEVKRRFTEWAREIAG